MAQINLIQLTFQDLHPKFPYKHRFNLESESLKQSIQEFGLLEPVHVVREEDKWLLLSGHRRLNALEALAEDSIPAIVIEGVCEKKKLFLLSLLLNWESQFEDLDLARMLYRAKTDFEFSDDEIFNELMPSVGLKADRRMISESLELFQLQSGLLRLIREGQLPMRGARVLSRLNESDQETFTHKIAAFAKLSSSQLMQVGEWLCDLLKIHGTSLAEFLQKWDLQENLCDEKLDKRQRADRFCAQVQEARFPEWVKKRQAFRRQVGEIGKFPEGVEIGAPDYFEEEGFFIRVQAKNKAQLASILGELNQSQNRLNSLFDIVL